MKGIPPTFAPAVGESGKDALGGVLPCNSPFPRVQIANVVQPQPGSRFFSGHFPLVHDDHKVAKPNDMVGVVGADNNGFVPLQTAQLLPQRPLVAKVQAAGRLVQQQRGEAP